MTAHGAGGIGSNGTEYNQISFQTYHPIAEDTLFDIAESAGLRPIAVDYHRFVYGKPSEEADGDDA